MDHPNGLTWRTSSYSGSNGGNCIEVATRADAVVVRDSKDPRGPMLEFGGQNWERFADQVKADTD
jgi:Domain of unknown function (DUF397)